MQAEAELYATVLRKNLRLPSTHDRLAMAEFKEQWRSLYIWLSATSPSLTLDDHSTKLPPILLLAPPDFVAPLPCTFHMVAASH